MTFILANYFVKYFANCIENQNWFQISCQLIRRVIDNSQQFWQSKSEISQSTKQKGQIKMLSRQKPRIVSILITIIVCFLFLKGGNSQCSSPYPLYQPNSDSCYSECPWYSSTKYYAYYPNNYCYQTCPNSYHEFDGSKSCVQCSSPTPFFFPPNGNCYSECPWSLPNKYYAYYPNNKCYQTCPNAYHNFDGNKTCIQCSSPTPLFQSNTGKCYAECPWNPPTKYYAYYTNNECYEICPNSHYAFDGNKTCMNSCPASPNMTYYDSVNWRCVQLCPKNTYAFVSDVSSPNYQHCLSSCPSGTFGDDQTRHCVTQCPQDTFYMSASIRICTNRCPADFYANPINRECVSGGSCPTTPVRYFSQDSNNKCVQDCTGNTFADELTGRCIFHCSNTYFADRTTMKCVQTCPANYYRDNVTRSCLLQCSEGYYADSQTQNCTNFCTAGTYGDPISLKCENTCLLPNYADNSVRLCVSTCSFGYFADNHTQSCVVPINCFANTVGDPTTRKCVNSSDCPSAPYHFANLVSKICVTRCNYPLWGDRSTKKCETECAWNPGVYVSYKNADIQECVTKCPQYPISYADNNSRACVLACPQSPSVQFDTFADDISQSCVRTCPNMFKSQKPQNICVSQCSNNPVILFYYRVNGSCETSCPQGFFADSSRQLCTEVCPSTPETFSYEPNNTCLQSCPNGYFADHSTRKCVQACPFTTLTYADDSTNKCVEKCPLIPDYYGEDLNDGTRQCVGTCALGHFADPITRTCVKYCDIDEGYYGYDKVCVLECPSNWFADNTTKQCVNVCPEHPIQTFGNPQNKRCVQKCPQHLYANTVTNLCVIPTSCQTATFADDTTNRCVTICPASDLSFGQLTSRRCLKSCPQGQYADNTTRRCSSSCNTTARLFKDPSTKTCVRRCPSNPNLYADPLTNQCSQRCTSNYFAFDQQRTCVPICPSTPSLFGDMSTYRCVQKCARQTYKYVNNTFRGCVNSCPERVTAAGNVILYALNTTWECVSLCPESENMFNFRHPSDTSDRRCVYTCPMVGTIYYFAQNVTQSCLLNCPSATHLTYGDIFSSKCVSECSRDQYRDNTTKRCVYRCSNGFYADNTTWNCVTKCPAPLFAETINKTCARECPKGFYADNQTRFCRSLCDHNTFLWSDNTTWQCVTSCPSIPSLFADPNTDKCQFHCTNGKYANNVTRSCVTALNCSVGYKAQPNTMTCTTICPIQIPSFHDTASNICIEMCNANQYADNSTMRCVDVCPSNPDYYGYNDSTLAGLCVLYCPTNWYRHSVTRHCVTSCPSPDYYKDPLTMTCVTSCSAHYHAETIGRICVINCGINSKYGFQGTCYNQNSCPAGTKADITTYTCVHVCPFGYFAQLGICVQNCVNGYADPISKECVQNCGSGYYSYLPDRKCVRHCGMSTVQYYALQDTRSCVTNCPQTADNNTNLFRQPVSDKCVNKCLPGWYSDDLSRNCETTCTSPLIADNSTGRCVSKCPSIPDYYGYNLICYFPCPSPTLFAENTTRTCLTLCPTGSFADKYNRRCMDICTDTQYSFSDGSATLTDNICLDICPQNYYATDTNKSCVQVCPQGSYGQNVTNKCVAKCPTGSFADQHLNLCVSECRAAVSQYADPSTLRCVTLCPTIPSLYAQDSSRSCVSSCQLNWFGLNTTRVCIQNCPSPYFADPVTGFCVLKCQIHTNYYADNFTRTCSLTCPDITAANGTIINTYADDSSKSCVFRCPSFPHTWGQNQTNKCVYDCDAGTYGDNDTRICHDRCFFGINVGVNGSPKYTWRDNSTNFCVPQCPVNSWADNITNYCAQECTLAYYADNSTWRCVFMCPTNPWTFSDTETGKCVQKCPNRTLANGSVVITFANQANRHCTEECPKKPFYYYKDIQNNECTKDCRYPFFGQDLTQTCVSACAIGYYQDLSLHLCEKCPQSCLSCVAQLNCTSCVPGLYSHFGQCLTVCPSFPVRYYKNDLSSSCVQACTSPYFGFQGTGKCEINCPQTYYNDVTTSTCKDCPQGCRRCLIRACTGCLQGYIYVQSLSICSKICNETHQYYLAGECVSSCVEGTFLLTDLVTCQKCSRACKTCSVMGTNCTTCASKFWYNYQCVEECPKRFYVDSTYACRQCDASIPQCSQQPLSFSLNTFTRDYTLYAEVRFSRSIANLTDEKFRELAKLRTADGPIKPNQYTITKKSESVYLITFKNGGSLNQQSLSVGFDPGFIFDANGNPLTSTVTQTEVAVVTSVSQQTVEEVTALAQDINVVSYILLVIVCLMMLKCSYPILILVDALQIMYMHLYVFVSPRPYLWMKIIKQFENLHFTFLPQIVPTTHQETGSSYPYQSFKEDTTFLGNMQPFVFIMSFFSAMFLLFWLLTLFNKKFNCSKCFTRNCKKIFKLRMKYSIIHEAFYYTVLFTVFFAAYQFKGVHANLQNSGANMGLAATIFTIFILELIILTYLGSTTRNRLENMPKRHKFLTYEQSKFAMQMPLRFFYKIILALLLLIQASSLQLVAMMILNLVVLIYYAIFRPSKHKITNILNILIFAFWIIIEAVIFGYDRSDYSNTTQQIFSYALFSIFGLMMLLIFVWCIYRLVIWFKYDILGYQKTIEQDSVKQKAKGKTKSLHQPLKSDEKDISDKQKDLNVSELNINDQQDQQQNDHTQNADDVMKEFAYHFSPKKTAGLLKMERELMGHKQNDEKNKKRHGPIVVEIDEDQLINEHNTRQEKRKQKKQVSPEKRRSRRDILNIRQNEDTDSVEEIELQESLPSGSRLEQRKKNNEVIWDNVEISDSQKSDF